MSAPESQSGESQSGESQPGESQSEEAALRLGASLATVGYGVLALAVPGALPEAGVEALPVAQARARVAGPRASVSLPPVGGPAASTLGGATLYRAEREWAPEEPAVAGAAAAPGEPATAGQAASAGEPLPAAASEPVAGEPAEDAAGEPLRGPDRDEREALMRDLRLLDEL